MSGSTSGLLVITFFLAEHQIVDDTGRMVGYRRLAEIAETLKPVLLRRGKSEVLHELPERMDKTLFVPMTAPQSQHHEENREIVARIVAKWRRLRFLSEADQRRLMIALQNMGMACDSTYLLDGSTDHGVKADELATLLAEMLEQPDAKVVVFSQWVRMHELIIRRLEARRVRHVFFHGGIPGRLRPDLIRRFREDPRCRIFLSTDAGVVGLNLQHASVVINMDQPWNPAVLEQRIGRVHRLGQLSRFVAAAQATPSGQDGGNRTLTALVGRDTKTGQAYLRLPIPNEDTLNQIAGALGALAKAFGLRL